MASSTNEESEPKTVAQARPERLRWRFSPAIVWAYFALIFALLCVSSFVQKSLTVDEPVHLFAGYSYLKWSDFRANPEHPPFAKIWGALPLLALDINDSRPSTPHWDLITETADGSATVAVADQMLFVDNDAESLFFYAKLQMIALSILLGIFVYLWSEKLFGFEAAVAALFVYALDPNILAHSSIVHTDIPFAAFFFIGTYFFWRFLDRATWTNLMLMAVFSGLAAVTKYSYPVILLVWMLLGIGRIISVKPIASFFAGRGELAKRWQKATVITGALACAALTAYVFIWSVYGFRYNTIPGGALRFHMDWMMPAENSPLRSIASFLNTYQLFPEAWIYGQLFVRKNLERPAYLLGQISPDGFWNYFPVAFAVKTPLPTLILLVIALWYVLRGRIERTRGLFLLVPAVIYFALAVFSRINIGLRHILPIYPFLFVLIGGGVGQLWNGKTYRKRGGLIFLAIWYVGSSIWIYPHYLSFFNEIVGSPKNAYKILLDSNVDWGQDLKGLKRWMDTQGVRKIQLMYFGYAAPEYYGIDATYMTGSWMAYDLPATQTAITPQYIAISANLLYSPEFLSLAPKSEEQVRPFRSKVPVARIGHSILVFRTGEAEKP